MCGKFIRKGPWDQCCGKEGRTWYRAEGAIALLCSDPQIPPRWAYRAGTVLCHASFRRRDHVFISHIDNLSQCLTSHPQEGEEHKILGEAAASQGCKLYVAAGCRLWLYVGSMQLLGNKSFPKQEPQRLLSFHFISFLQEQFKKKIKKGLGLNHNLQELGNREQSGQELGDGGRKSVECIRSTRQLNCGFDGCFQSSVCRNTILYHSNPIKLGALCAKCSVLYANKSCSVNKPHLYSFFYTCLLTILYIFLLPYLQQFIPL